VRGEGRARTRAGAPRPGVQGQGCRAAARRGGTYDLLPAAPQCHVEDTGSTALRPWRPPFPASRPPTTRLVDNIDGSGTPEPAGASGGAGASEAAASGKQSAAAAAGQGTKRAASRSRSRQPKAAHTEAGPTPAQPPRRHGGRSATEAPAPQPLPLVVPGGAGAAPYTALFSVPVGHTLVQVGPGLFALTPTEEAAAAAAPPLAAPPPPLAEQRAVLAAAAERGGAAAVAGRRRVRVAKQQVKAEPQASAVEGAVALIKTEPLVFESLPPGERAAAAAAPAAEAGAGRGVADGEAPGSGSDERAAAKKRGPSQRFRWG
jgi:hypothetical protein